MDKVIKFSKFDGGNIVPSEGILKEVNEKDVVVIHDEKIYRFKRDPGPKSGYGIGSAKFWRLSQEERKEYCYPDIPSRRR